MSNLSPCQTEDCPTSHREYRHERHRQRPFCLNLIKVIKRNAFGFRNFDNFKTRILIALNIKKERTNLGAH
ncbi:transposase [Streptococcus merionis]|uniref:transposase n=1 Tax=Streptococcus merionis TaxID=400065 RepID=UPI00350E5445